MVEKDSLKTRLVLIGGSISHIFTLSKLTKQVARGQGRASMFEVLLISPTRKYFYPDMLGGFLEGKCGAEELLFDLEEICHGFGASFMLGDVDRIDVKERRVCLKDGQNIPFDILAVDIHCQLEGEEIEGVKKFAIPVNSFEKLMNLKDHFLERQIDYHITVVGSSSQALELVFAIYELTKARGMEAHITMIDGAHSILPGYDYDAKNIVCAELKKRKVELILGRRITLVTEDFLVFEDRAILKHDYLIWLTEPVAGPIFKRSGFTVDDKGLMVVNHHLRSIDASNIFSVGGSIRTQDGNSLKMRSHGKIEAAVLHGNIKSRIDRAPLKRTVDPARKCLQVLSLGEGTGIICYRHFVYKGKIGWKIRYYLHKRLMKQLLK